MYAKPNRIVLKSAKFDNEEISLIAEENIRTKQTQYRVVQRSSNLPDGPYWAIETALSIYKRLEDSLS